MSFTLDGFIACLQSGLTYLPNTLLLTFIPVIIGLIFGTMIALVRLFKVPVLSQILAVFVAAYAGVPFIVFLLIYNLLFMLKFNDVAAFFGSSLTIADVNSIWVGCFALSLMNIVYMSESIRGAFLAVDEGQYEAARSVGLTTSQTLRRIIVPQMIPVAIPVLTNNVIGALKATSLVITIGVMDVLNGSLLPAQTTYSFLVGYMAAAVIYWCLTIIIEKAAEYYEKSRGTFRRSLT